MAASGCNGHGTRSPDVEHLATTINDDPDKAHGNWTPAVYDLIKIGKPAIPTLLDLMVSGDEMTRRRADFALQGITLQMYGFEFGQGWRSNREDEWRAFWASLGSLDWHDSEQKRKDAVQLWRRWLKEQP